MQNIKFKEFFKNATGYEPYPYQEDLANRKDIPEIINIPTGAGKTESAIIALYLWRIFNNIDESVDTPKRLIYCLPMRVLVEQVLKRVEKWVKNLQMKSKIDVVTLVGGSVNRDYRLCPEKNTIIIGTQDMLLSRALNRGYSMSPFQWPVEFALLNNDCMWIMDEIQLMHNGLATSIQLEQFREKFGTFGYHKTVWMSATINKQWFETTINSKSKSYELFELTKKDSEHKLLSKRNTAKKILKELELPNHKDEYTKDDATAILEKCDKNHISLIIVNTVKRAQSLFKELEKLGETEMILIHSRFRQKERQELNKKIQEISNKEFKEKRIIISTQVVEAGVDISSSVMITEMSPWPSMIQRFGRCNRKGEDDDATVYFIRLGEKQYIPYEPKDMQESEKKIDEIKNKSISPIDIPKIEQKIIHEAVIRESDMIGLFDTGSDLSGGYTDVSRFVRSLDETYDVGVIWRQFDENKPLLLKVRTEEICSVPISGIKEFIKRKKIVWNYNIVDGKWDKTRNPQPGKVYLIHTDSGGYSEKIGWDLEQKESVKTVEIISTNIKNETSDKSNVTEDEESHDSDYLSYNKDWITLNDHTFHVIEKTKVIINEIKYLTNFKDILKQVAKYHDMGKAHVVFQEAMLKNTGNEISRNELWAKRGGHANYNRKYFRHELASALMFLKLRPKHDGKDLIAYLIASHHGRIRLSIRSLPRKKTVDQNSTENYILGIPLDKTESVKVFLSDKYAKSEHSKEKPILQEKNIDDTVEINASITKIGQNDGMESWLQITLGLLEKYGPFQLAYLEAIIRAGDVRASQDEGKQK